MESEEVNWAKTAFSDHFKRHGDHEKTVDLVVLSWTKIDKVMRSIIGKGGIDALYHASIETTARDHPWLCAASTSLQSPIDLDRLRRVLLAQPPHDFDIACDGLLQHFHRLLVDLIGPSLTDRLLRPALCPLLTDSAGEEKS